MVERRLAKAKVAGSSPVIRSRTMRVRFIRIRICYKLNTAPGPSGKARVCKTLIPGPIPGGASKKSSENRKIFTVFLLSMPFFTSFEPLFDRIGIRFESN